MTRSRVTDGNRSNSCVSGSRVDGLYGPTSGPRVVIPSTAGVLIYPRFAFRTRRYDSTVYPRAGMARHARRDAGLPTLTPCPLIPSLAYQKLNIPLLLVYSTLDVGPCAFVLARGDEMMAS